MPDYHLVAGNLIEKDGEYALVQEGKEHVRGQWNVPAGSIEKEENPKKAAEREALEETGLEIKPEGLAGVFFDQSDYLDATVIIIVFYTEVKEDYILKPEDEEEILKTGFFSKHEIKDMDLRTPFIIRAIENAEKGKIQGLETVKDYR
ncbi:hypothetical protein AQV86_02210 [Nanohaloarchaea archaeon SG9]|nr:hypothetical protein AQV86_02210 [Nanohaloarchaea archaeon SG9]